MIDAPVQKVDLSSECHRIVKSFNGHIINIIAGMLGNAGAIDDRQDDDYDQGLNENHRTRQLLKVLAISDVVIYKSRAERLHTDLFYFMGDASKAYNEHFSSELQKVLFFFQPLR